MSMGEFYVLAAGLAFLAIFVTGRRLVRARASGNVAILTAHKVLSVAAAALIVVTAVRVRGESSLTVSDWITTGTAWVGFAVAMTTGGILSARGSGSRALRLSHRISALTTVAASAAALYFLLVCQ